MQQPLLEIRTPQLLVSVRNAHEAHAALAGGCDILDVKEPSQGSLGMAPWDAIAAVVGAARADDRRIPVSAALGEVVDWEHAPASQPLPTGLRYVKIGLAGLGRRPDWAGRWRAVRRQFHHADGATFHWIAVVYADWELADAPDPASIVDAALDEAKGDVPCRGVLFDTFSKNGRTLTDALDPTELAAFAKAAHAGGLLFALAGSLQQEMLPALRSVNPDIIAIRTAACARFDRSASVDAQMVERFRAASIQAFCGDVSSSRADDGVGCFDAKPSKSVAPR